MEGFPPEVRCVLSSRHDLGMMSAMKAEAKAVDNRRVRRAGLLSGLLVSLLTAPTAAAELNRRGVRWRQRRLEA